MTQFEPSKNHILNVTLTNLKNSTLHIIWLQLEKKLLSLAQARIFLGFFFSPGTRFQAIVFRFFFVLQNFFFFKSDYYQLKSLYFALLFVVTRKIFTSFGESMFFFFKWNFNFSLKLELEKLVFRFFRTCDTCISNVTLTILKNSLLRIIWFHLEKITSSSANKQFLLFFYPNQYFQRWFFTYFPTSETYFSNVIAINLNNFLLQIFGSSQRKNSPPVEQETFF